MAHLIPDNPIADTINHFDFNANSIAGCPHDVIECIKQRRTFIFDMEHSEFEAYCKEIEQEWPASVWINGPVENIDWKLYIYSVGANAPQRTIDDLYESLATRWNKYPQYDFIVITHKRTLPPTPIYVHNTHA